MCRTGKILENSDSGAGGSGRGKLWQNKRKKKAWNVVIVIRKQHLALKKKKKQLQNRLSRMSGQLNGISRMLEENRYCGDILTQVAAVESALQAFGYAILKEHMETCVVEEIQKGNTAVVDEAVELVKKLK